MTIYVVKPGDSVWSIANRYGANPDEIVRINGLEDIPYLVVGQALVIPTNETVNKGTIEVNGYIEPSTPEADVKIVDEAGKFLTYISPFSYQVNPDGTLNPVNDAAILDAAKKFRVAPLLVITNFRNGNFDTTLVHNILSTETLQDTLIQNMLTTLKNKDYYGVNIDFERIPPEDRQLYNDFLRKVVGALHPQNYVVSTALVPKPYDITTGAWHGAHDYKAHGEIVDFVIIMTYEWGWSGGPPMAVAPINEVRKVISYAASVIPPKKIMMGMPLYGYDWTLPYVEGGKFARRVSPQGAVQLAGKYGAAIQYDSQSQAPFFYYTDEQKVQHVVWFEDARSFEAKYKLALEFGLRGVSYWELGLPFPQNWAVLEGMFNIVKHR